MHRLPSHSTVTRFRVASVLIVLAALLIPSSLGLIVWAMVSDSRERMLLGGILAIAALLLIFCQWLVGARARCPLCLQPSLLRKSCSKHRTARRLFGSHRLRVAVSIMCRGHFRCPYCGEPTAMEVRRYARR